ncbi:MAG TPA: hypothetical protein VFU89_01740 [Rhabdochlamydiaceae bacterium]|nr:hypothetical protein [Rhabdochlamydiaceae bacterium]
MELSLFLAKLLGVYMLIVAVELILRRHEFEGAVRDFAASKGLIVFSGSVSLILGLAIAIGHPIYEFNFRGLITLIGYLLILRGIWRMAFPSRLQKRMATCFHQGYRECLIILIILGIYLTYTGFNQVMIP